MSNPKSSRPPYGRVDCCVITGDDDVAKHCAMNVLRNLQHVRSVFPPCGGRGLGGGGGAGAVLLGSVPPIMSGAR